MNESRFYEYEFDKRGIAAETGIAKTDLLKVADHLVRYFNDREDSAQVEVMRAGRPFEIFNEREVTHLGDVKTIIRFFYLLQWAAATYIGAYLIVLGIWRRRSFLQDVTGTLVRGSLVTLSVIGLLGLWALIDFDSLFRVFHHLGFRNDLWLLDPSRDYLIMLFPEGFFFDGALCLVGALIGELLLVGGIAWIYRRRQNRCPPGQSPAPESARPL